MQLGTDPPTKTTPQNWNTPVLNIFNHSPRLGIFYPTPFLTTLRLEAKKKHENVNIIQNLTQHN